MKIPSLPPICSRSMMCRAPRVRVQHVESSHLIWTWICPSVCSRIKCVCVRTECPIRDNQEKGLEEGSGDVKTYRAGRKQEIKTERGVMSCGEEWGCVSNLRAKGWSTLCVCACSDSLGLCLLLPKSRHFLYWILVVGSMAKKCLAQYGFK